MGESGRETGQILGNRSEPEFGVGIVYKFEHGKMNCHNLKGVAPVSYTHLDVYKRQVLNNGITVINNVPRIQDVFCMMGILDSLGCSCVLDGHSLTIDAVGLSRFSIPKAEMEKMRSSIMLLGALLGRCKEAEVYYPGGCMIGKRPIDLHLMALEKMGARIREGQGDEPLRASVPRLRGTVVDFPFPSVGATENAIFAAVAASGKTVLNGCAKEPEIVELCRFMNNMGASVRGCLLYTSRCV